MFNTSMAKCSRCGRKLAKIKLGYLQEELCTDCFDRFFEKRVRRTIRVNGLLKTDDKVCVAVSGGKDSAVVASIMKKLSKKAPRSELFAMTVDEGIPSKKGAFKAAEALCSELGIEQHVITFKEELGSTMEQIMRRVRELKSPAHGCTYCGVLRRQILNQKARELGATKLATGHNLDDEIQVGMMNFIRGELDRLARMGAIVGVIADKKFVPRIKPLRESPEDEVRFYAESNCIPFASTICKYSEEAFRGTMRAAVDLIEDRHTGSKYQILRSIDSLVPILRGDFEKRTKGKIGYCRECGELASAEECNVCKIKKQVGLI